MRTSIVEFIAEPIWNSQFAILKEITMAAQAKSSIVLIAPIVFYS